MKIYRLILIYLLMGNLLQAQVITKLSLEEAYTLLEKQYPSLQNTPLLHQIHQKELEQLDFSDLPELFVKADGRVQTQSTSLKPEEGVMIPFEIDQPLFSIKTYAEARYQIMDGGRKDAQRKLKDAKLLSDLQTIEVEKFSLRERINQLFIGTNLLKEQSKLIDISLIDLESRKEQVAAGVELGVLLESELTKIEVKELELIALQDNLRFQLSGLIKTLSQLTGTTLSEEVTLKFPSLSSPTDIPELKRPEQELFQQQRETIMAQSDLIDVSNKVQLSAYAQAGIGYPNPLNIFENNIAPFGILGAQLAWKITDWKKGDTDRELLILQTQKLHHTEATFEFNIQSKEANYLASVERLYAQIESDKKIAQLQANILVQLAAQLDEGVITSSDYITQVNAELLARQNLLIHQTELLNNQLEFWNERGGF